MSFERGLNHVNHVNQRYLRSILAADDADFGCLFVKPTGDFVVQSPSQLFFLGFC